jgi:hypothetical protein
VDTALLQSGTASLREYRDESPGAHGRVGLNKAISYDERMLRVFD